MLAPMEGADGSMSGELRPTTWNSAPCASHVGIPISHTSRMRMAFFIYIKI